MINTRITTTYNGNDLWSMILGWFKCPAVKRHWFVSCWLFNMINKWS